MRHLLGPVIETLRYLDAPPNHLIQRTLQLLPRGQNQDTPTPLCIDLLNQSLNAFCMIDPLQIVALKEMREPRRSELSGKPSMTAKMMTLSIKKQSADAVGVSLIV